MKPITPQEKLKELVLYVAQRCANHDLFGKIKLNKILFFSEVLAFRRLGRPIAGVQYVKREFGPVPEHMDELLQQLQDDRAAAIEERDMPDMRVQKRVVPLQKPDLSSFSADDISIVSEVIDWFRLISANDVSDLSHRSVGWDVARMGEFIPLSTAIIPDVQMPLTQKERQRAAQLAERVAGQLGA